MTALSPNTQAVLLLTAPLILGRESDHSKLLSHLEYSRLARHLLDLQLEPADLIGTDSGDLIAACDAVVSQDRLKTLLGRGFLLSQVVERWQARSIWVLGRADALYPRKLKARMKGSAPALLYGCGPPELLEDGDLAVVGSRQIDEELIDFTRAVGELAARSGRVVVSGGARGVDQAAMNGALASEGKAIGVLADSLEKAALQREHRQFLREGRLVLVSPYDPLAGFHVGHAMQRNKLIYGLARISLVMQADLDKGGTWAGAVEQLDKLRFVPVYIRTLGKTSPGLDALLMRGGRPWPNPQDTEGFEATFDPTPESPQHKKEQAVLDLSSSEAPVIALLPSLLQGLLVMPAQAAAEQASGRVAAASRAFDNVLSHDVPLEAMREIVRRLPESSIVVGSEIADELQVPKAKVQLWLKLLVNEGILARQKKPARYVTNPARLFT